MNSHVHVILGNNCTQIHVITYSNYGIGNRMITILWRALNLAKQPPLVLIWQSECSMSYVHVLSLDRQVLNLVIFEELAKSSNYDL